jgi:LPS sulfotransferase NodH
MFSPTILGRLIPSEVFARAFDPSLRGTNREYARVILISYARSGSTLLQTLLDSHPNVLFFHEPFNPERIARHRMMNRLRAIAPESWARAICADGRPAAVKVVGFKYFYSSAAKFPTLLDYFNRLDRVFVIRLTRQTLPRCCSIHMVRRTSQWHNITGESRAPVQLRFTPEVLEQFFAMDEGARKFVATALPDKPSVSIRYEDFCADRQPFLRDVLNALDLPRVELQSPLHKMEARTPADVIENYEELKQHFAGTRWAHHFDDAWVPSAASDAVDCVAHTA